MTTRAKVGILRWIARHALWRRGYGMILVLRWRREFERLGIVESQLRGEPVDAAGHPVPWLSMPALAFLEERMPSGLSVLEYGSGNSTLWWSRRAARVVSVEHDAAFHSRLRLGCRTTSAACWRRTSPMAPTNNRRSVSAAPSTSW